MVRIMVDADGAIVAEMTSTRYLANDARTQFERRAEFEPAPDATGSRYRIR